MAIPKDIFAVRWQVRKNRVAVAASMAAAFASARRLAPGFLAPCERVAHSSMPITQAVIPNTAQPRAASPLAPAALACAAVGAAFHRRLHGTRRRGGGIADAEGDGSIENMSYAEIPPVQIEVSPGAEGLFEKKATQTLKKIKSDITRHRYGDTSHLDSALKVLGLTTPHGKLPQLQKVIESQAENGELECTFVFSSQDVPYTSWSDLTKLDTMDRFFGPGLWSMVYKYDGAKKLAAMRLTTGNRPDECASAQGALETLAVASFISSKKSVCVHPDREDPYLCGDCPRNPSKTMKDWQECGSSACCGMISSYKKTCIHKDREWPNICGDCPRNEDY